MREKLQGIHKFVGKVFLCDQMTDAKNVSANYWKQHDYRGICRSGALIMSIRDANFLIKAGVFAVDAFGIAFIFSRFI